MGAVLRQPSPPGRQLHQHRPAPSSRGLGALPGDNRLWRLRPAHGRPLRERAAALRLLPEPLGPHEGPGLPLRAGRHHRRARGQQPPRCPFRRGGLPRPRRCGRGHGPERPAGPSRRARAGARPLPVRAGREGAVGGRAREQARSPQLRSALRGTLARAGRSRGCSGRSQGHDGPTTREGGARSCRCQPAHALVRPHYERPRPQTPAPGPGRGRHHAPRR